MRLEISLGKRQRGPIQPIVKFNIDATYDQTTWKDFVGIICRDGSGTFHCVTSLRIFAPTSLLAESLGLHEAMAFARNLNLQTMTFESDNLTPTEAYKGGKFCKDTKNIIEDIKFLKRNIQRRDFIQVPHEANVTTHIVASLASSSSLLGCWLLSPPHPLHIAILLDCGHGLSSRPLLWVVVCSAYGFGVSFPVISRSTFQLKLD